MDNFKIYDTNIYDYIDATTNLNVPRFNSTSSALNGINPTGDILFTENDQNYYGSIDNQLVLLGGQNANRSYMEFCHNFNDDINTGQIYLPWADSFEVNNIGSSRSPLLGNCALELLKFSIRPGNYTTPFELTIRFFCIDNGNPPTNPNRVNQSLATINFNPTEQFTVKDVTPADFMTLSAPGNLTIGPTQLGYFTIQADTDPSSSAIDWYVTTSWRTDFSCV